MTFLQIILAKRQKMCYTIHSRTSAANAIEVLFTGNGCSL